MAVKSCFDFPEFALDGGGNGFGIVAATVDGNADIEVTSACCGRSCAACCGHGRIDADGIAEFWPLLLLAIVQQGKAAINQAACFDLTQTTIGQHFNTTAAPSTDQAAQAVETLFATDGTNV